MSNDRLLWFVREHQEELKMRLTCPNCDAQYEVPDEVMPTSGRDVQCSNCGQTWFQHHPDHTPEDETQANPLGDNEPDPDEEVSPPPPPATPTGNEPARRKLDPAVADILRQEAEAEYAARNRPSPSSLEMQPDLGLEETQNNQSHDLDDTERRTLEAKRRMARMRGEPDPTIEAVLAGGPRRELLPDIEEINSTLRSDAYRSKTDPELVTSHSGDRDGTSKGGFKRGFLLMLVIMALVAVIYIFAPQIARAVPQVDPYLSGFVSWVDGIRGALDAQVKTILGWLDSVASQASE
jgi:predicted Zn finger-like uncharacterized protein